MDENGELERKADMFFKRTIKPHKPVTEVDTADEALAVSMLSLIHIFEMHNELRDTPKTGDNSNVGLWTALAGLSALGIVGTAVVAYRKKKKANNVCFSSPPAAPLPACAPSRG